jgi:TRAP-type C4-dicarboxylate transport system substrate-binding protein
VWDIDRALRVQLDAMGIPTLPLPIEDAGKALEDGRIDGIIGLPTAALAFQWASLARYYTELPVATMPGCLVVSHHAFDALSTEQQQQVRSASAKFFLRFVDVSEHQDQQLLSGLFERQGMQRVPVSAQFLFDFHEAARRAHGAIGRDLVSPSLIQQVVIWLTQSPQ